MQCLLALTVWVLSASIARTAGFGPTPQPPHTHARLNKTVSVDEGNILGTTTRHYQLYVPQQLSTPSSGVPLILHFHGQGVVQPLQLRKPSNTTTTYNSNLYDPDTPRYDQLADQRGFIMVYPLGMGDGNCGM